MGMEHKPAHCLKNASWLNAAHLVCISRNERGEHYNDVLARSSLSLYLICAHTQHIHIDSHRNSFFPPFFQSLFPVLLSNLFIHHSALYLLPLKFQSGDIWGIMTRTTVSGPIFISDLSCVEDRSERLRSWEMSDEETHGQKTRCKWGHSVVRSQTHADEIGT